MTVDYVAYSVVVHSAEVGDKVAGYYHCTRGSFGVCLGKIKPIANSQITSFID